MKKRHLAIIPKNKIRQIIEGKRLFEIRLSEKKTVPFGLVERGDLVYLKPPGEEVLGQFEVIQVVSFDGLEQLDQKFITDIYFSNLNSESENSKNEWLKKIQVSHFATIIKIGKVEQFITSPIKVTKKDSRAWVVLEKI